MLTDNSPTSLGLVTGLGCLECKRFYTLPQLKETTGTIFQYICEMCFGPLDVKYGMEKVRTAVKEMQTRPDTFWKFRELLPANREYVAAGLPFTPLRRSLKLGSGLGIDLYFKMDAELPTGSFKDRPVAMAINAALESGDYHAVLVASTGNLAISTAYFAAQNGIGCEILVPRSLGEVKKRAIRAQLGEKGKLVEMAASYDEANRIAMERADEIGRSGAKVVGPNTSFRPFYKEGSKTNGMEAAWQLDQVEPPDRPFYNVYPVGSGALFVSAYKGITQLRELGMTRRDVHMVAVQAGNVPPIVDGFVHFQQTKGKEKGIVPVKVTDNTTIAKSIAIGNPGSGYQALDVLDRSGGTVAKVSEQEIVEWSLRLFEEEQMFAQDVGGVVMAGVARLVGSGEIKPGSLVVANITGTGKNRFEDDIWEAANQYGDGRNRFAERARSMLTGEGWEGLPK